MTCRFRRFTLPLALALLAVGLLPSAAIADPIDPMQRTWMRTDQPVASGAESRTWMWGPQQIAYATEEAYLESPDGERNVIYYDKARMEVTRPDADTSSSWYVTNGLLVVEMVEGRVQTGDATFDDALEPANVPIVGDLDSGGLTYAQIAAYELRDEPARTVGGRIDAYVDVDGQIRTGAQYAGYGATAGYEVNEPGIHHTVASVFWAFMNDSGTVWENGEYTEDLLFENPFYATGYPITEAYWTTTAVGGGATEVLWQCFERRCLTWTPGNDPGWQVEAGNVGLHYYHWRYGAERPAAPTLAVTFNLSYNGELLARTVTTETFLGQTAVGTWETVTVDGVGSSHGSLVANHTLGRIEAVVFQDWPFPGTATMIFTYDINALEVSGTGTLTWSAYIPAGIQSGTVSFSATSSSLDVWDVELDEVPPVLFTVDEG